MKLQCAVIDDYQGVSHRYGPWDQLRNVELTVFNDHLTQEDEVAQRLAAFDIVVAMRERTPFPASLLARLPRLKLLVTSGMRNAAIDLRTARNLGVTVCGTASNSEPAAELTWALILGLARQLFPENLSLRNQGPWQRTVGSDLHGSTLGVVGLGKIGSQIARVGSAFGMNVIAWSENLTREQTIAERVQLASSKDELLTKSDFVSLHLVLGERTRNIIGARELDLMKSSAYLINTSRAGLVDQTALAASLSEGKIAGAGLDVFAEEPLPGDSPFRKLPNVLATPHLGYVTERNYRTYFTEAVENIQAFLSQTPIRSLN